MSLGIISQAKGSSYVEWGNTKVCCGVYGPKDVQRGNDFKMSCQVGEYGLWFCLHLPYHFTLHCFYSALCVATFLFCIIITVLHILGIPYCYY